MTKKFPNIKRDIIFLILAILLFSLSFFLLYFAKSDKTFAEWYAVSIYPLWVTTLGRISSIFSFSLSELFLYVFSFSILLLLIRYIYRVIRKKAKVYSLLHGILYLFVFASVLMLLYALNCGINYHRTSFSQLYGYQPSEYTVSELSALCLDLTNDINQRAPLVQRSFDGVCRLGRGMDKTAVSSMEHLGTIYPGLASYYPEPKPLLNSSFLSVRHLTGIYSPFTIEANYNRDMAPYNLPFTVCHELAHLNGFMQEQEANFIAYLACVNSDNLEFQYSGSLTAWIYSTNALYKEDKTAYNIITSMLDPSVLADLHANQDFWRQYRSEIATVATKINDAYLKANGQTEGVKSYNKLVDMLIILKRREGALF